MESKKLIVTASPHITNHTSTRGLMLNVCIALLPALVASTLIFGARALLVTGVTVAACVGFEALYCVVMKKPVPVGDFSAVVTGMILAFNLPATIPLWIAIIGDVYKRQPSSGPCMGPTHSGAGSPVSSIPKLTAHLKWRA